ncbi:MAG: hypothetical protein JW768_13755 [Chitinispirillaceae bacterium]|nr:hypothetical protein [Chitinispirillaceae bacterium]
MNVASSPRHVPEPWPAVIIALLCVTLECMRDHAPHLPFDMPVRQDLLQSVPVPRTPVAPAVDDTAFSITGLRSWYMVGDSLTKGTDTINAVIRAPVSVNRVDCFLDSSWAGTLGRDDSTFRLRLSIAHLSPGRHELLFSADTLDTAFACITVNRSAYYYVTVSNDWENPRSGNFDTNLSFSRTLHERHPDLVMTYFAGPYFFTDSFVSPERRQWIAGFLTAMRDEYGDETGLHIHPWCHFVHAAGVICITDSSAFDTLPDSTGYGISCYRYSENDFFRLLTTADSLFLAWGLGKPTSFRAGGWSCALHTMRALSRAGYRVDASGCNVSRMDEVAGAPSLVWLAQNWHTINDTAQPYYPSATDIADTVPPTLDVLEVPDNGVLADYVTAAEMIDIFNRNWNGVPLSAPRMCSIGYHIDNLDAYIDRLERALAHIDYYLAANGGGPVVYARMSDCVRVWQRAEAGIVRR